MQYRLIHGLTGDREETWTGEGALASWPQALLPNRIPQARILSFGYDAYVTGLLEVVSENRIRNHAKTFLRELANYRHLDNTVSWGISQLHICDNAVSNY